MKRILITYLNNGNLQSQVSKEMMFNRILNDMIEEGREVESTVLQPLSKSVLFDDGSKLLCYPISSANKGLRCTHVFIDNNITNKPNGMKAIYESIVPTLNWESAQFDTSGSRLNYFSFDESGLTVTEKTL